MIEREHRHPGPCPPLRLFAAQGNGADPFLLYTSPVSTEVSSSSAAKSVCQAEERAGGSDVMLWSVRMPNLGAARGIPARVAFEFVLHVEDCLLCAEVPVHPVCAILCALRDRRRADEEEQTAEDSLSECLDAHSLEHAMDASATPRTESVALCPVRFGTLRRDQVVWRPSWG
jgi:hypothetical protein